MWDFKTINFQFATNYINAKNLIISRLPILRIAFVELKPFGLGKYKIFFLLYKYLQTDTKQYAKNDLTKVKSSLIVLERFKDRMLIQNYSDSTISGYLSSLRGLMAFYNKSPLYITKQQVFKYLLKKAVCVLESADCNSIFYTHLLT